MTPADIRGWYARLKGSGTGPAALRQSYSLLHAIFATAVDDELLGRNPCKIRSARSDEAPERPVATLEQVQRLLDVVPGRYRGLILLGTWTAARWGELIALTPTTVDLRRGVMRIERQLVQPDRGPIVEGPPKSASGYRTISLPPHVIPELEHHMAAYVLPGQALLFVGDRGGVLRRGNFNEIFRDAATAAGLPPTFHFHDLRHTGNTLAATAGASTAELMSRMGHGTMQAAVRYQHASARRDAEIARRLTDLATLSEVDGDGTSVERRLRAL